MLDHTDEAFYATLSDRLPYPVCMLNTGGGCMVAAIDLTIDARLMGAQVWITRDGDEWLFGIYDYAHDPDDEGLVFTMHMLDRSGVDDPELVVAEIARTLDFFRRNFRALDIEQGIVEGKAI